MRLPLDQVIAHFDALARTGPPPPTTSREQWQRTARQTLLDRLETDATDVVLDLGCGTGELLHVLAPHVAACVGVDCSPSMLALAGARQPAHSNLSWQLGDLRDPPRVPGLTTVVLCHVVRLLEPAERAQLFARLFDQLEDQGLVAVGGLLWSVPRAQVEGVEDWLDGPLDHEVTTAALARELGSAGFRTRTEILHPGVAIVRGIKQRGGLGSAPRSGRG